MSCKGNVEQETDKIPSLLEKNSVYEKAIQAIKEAKPEDITQCITYMDENCKGCLVGHVLKITDGLDYKTYHADQNKRHFDFTEEGIVKKLLKKNFGEQGYALDGDLSTIHDDYINDALDFEEMQEKAIECLEAFRDKGSYGYESVNWDDDDYEPED